jgi:hypothetical protein
VRRRSSNIPPPQPIPLPGLIVEEPEEYFTPRTVPESPYDIALALAPARDVQQAGADAFARSQADLARAQQAGADAFARSQAELDAHAARVEAQVDALREQGEALQDRAEAQVEAFQEHAEAQVEQVAARGERTFRDMLAHGSQRFGAALADRVMERAERMHVPHLDLHGVPRRASTFDVSVLSCLVCALAPALTCDGFVSFWFGGADGALGEPDPQAAHGRGAPGSDAQDGPARARALRAQRCVAPPSISFRPPALTRPRRAARINSIALNIAIGLQVLFGALTTGLAAASRNRSVSDRPLSGPLTL